MTKGERRGGESTSGTSFIPSRAIILKVRGTVVYEEVHMVEGRVKQNIIDAIVLNFYYSCVIDHTHSSLLSSLSFFAAHSTSYKADLQIGQVRME